MKSIFAFFASLLAIVPVAVHSHAGEVRYCMTAPDTIRIFVSHTHGTQFSTSNKGTLRFTDNNDGTSTLKEPDGYANYVSSSYLWQYGCAEEETVQQAYCSSYSNWFYFDFPAECGKPVDYSMEETSGSMYLQSLYYCSGVPDTRIIENNGISCPNGNPISMPEVYQDENMLKDAWNMDEPYISYTKEDNTFHLTYTTTDFFKGFLPSTHLNEEFYDKNCKTGVPATEHVVDDGIYGVDWYNQFTSDPAEMYQQSNGVLRLDFHLEPNQLTTDSAIYTDNGSTGKLELCVRAAVGYDGDEDRTLNLQQQIDAGYKEVNFIESLVTITYDLQADFDVVDINVKPKDKVTTTFAEDEYGIEAWLCNITAASGDYQEYKYTPTGGSEVTRSYPPVIDDVNEFFRQGSLVSVCIRPIDDSYKEGIVMKEIVTFDWKRAGGPIPVEQEAVVASNPASNLLTYYPPCTNLDYCRISSILFADFYITEGAAEGSGAAKTQFKTSRRLGAEDNQGRALQEAETGGSRFDVNIALAATDDGPGALKTAGGVSLGFTALASFMALAGSMLFF